MNKAINTDSLRLITLGLLITIAGFVLAYQFVEPSPPKTITIASGSKTGAYFQYANRYAEILRRDGIELRVLNTQGSVDNIKLLTEGQADVAFVQGGVGNAEEQPDVVSLGSLYFEPLWVFVKTTSPVTKLSDLAGKPIAAGSQGSGTWAVVRQLMEQNGVKTSGPNIKHLSSADGARALFAGGVEAAFFVTSPSSPLMRDLLAAKDLRLVNFTRAEAYTRQLRYLSTVTLHQGVISLADNVPAQDMTLLAPAATLAAREGLHPALQNLLVQATLEVHAGGGVFENPGQFPSTLYVDYPLSADAKRYLEDGPPFLQRYLPFWAAVLFDRLKVMLVPLLTLLIPLFKILPPAYRWRVRSRIYRWYQDLAAIESHAAGAGADERRALIAELRGMEKEVRNLKVPLSYSDEVYNLRLHIDLVQRSL
ncbi:TAXI family TRAP transporter solute-binding subunit [Pseudomonadota bacterium]